MSCSPVAKVGREKKNDNVKQTNGGYHVKSHMNVI